MKKIRIAGTASPIPFATVSDEDYSKVKNYKWEAVKSPGERYYVRTKVNGRYVNLGRMVKDVSDRKTNVRYKDGNPFNNMRGNLLVN
jgi:hypothetical protein